MRQYRMTVAYLNSMGGTTRARYCGTLKEMCDVLAVYQASPKVNDVEEVSITPNLEK